MSTLDELGASHPEITKRAEFYAELSAIADGDLDPSVVENMIWLLEETEYSISEALPSGLYYGCTEGDGSDIGIWLVDPEEWCPACGLAFDDGVADEDLPHCADPDCWFDMRLI